jgi:fructose-1,6-bisphosphatase/inositol monophosphatase family enzyme
VYALASDNLLYAAKGQGAFANGAPLTVSSIADLAQATLLHGSLNLWLHNGYWGFLHNASNMQCTAYSGGCAKIPILHVRTASAQPVNRQAGVTWSHLAFACGFDS